MLVQYFLSTLIAPYLTSALRAPLVIFSTWWPDIALLLERSSDQPQRRKIFWSDIGNEPLFFSDCILALPSLSNLAILNEMNEHGHALAFYTWDAGYFSMDSLHYQYHHLYVYHAVDVIVMWCDLIWIKIVML